MLLFGLTANALFGQLNVERLDSLQRELESSTDRLIKVDLLMELMRELINSDLDEAFRLSKSAVALSEQSGDSLRMVKTYFAQGFILRRQNRLPESIELLNRAMRIGERNQFSSDLGRIYNSLAIAYTFSGKYANALSIHFKSLEFNEQKGTKEDVSITLNNIGFVYFKLKNYQEARSFYVRSLHIKDSIQSTFDVDRLLINLALCENQLKNYEQAENYIVKGLRLCGENCDPPIRLEAELGLGMSFLERRNDTQAIIHFREAYRISKNLNENRFTTESLISLAQINIRRQEYADALIFLDEAEDVAATAQYPDLLIQVFKNKSRIYYSLNEYKNAAIYQARYIHLKDSIYSDELINNLADVKAEFEERENLKTIREQDQVLQLKEEVIQRQRLQTIFITIIACLGIALTYLLFRFSRELQRKRTDLSVKNKQLYEVQNALRKVNRELDQLVEERTKDLAEINQSLVSTNEELDYFIYKTSHDIRGPLASLLGLAHLGKLEVTEPVASNYLHQIDGTASKLNVVLSKMAKINQISRGELQPTRVDLQAVLNAIIARQTAQLPPGRVEVSIDMVGDVQLISDAALIETCLENLVSNAIKYRSESVRIQPFVNIQVEQKMHAVLVRVIDNGIGIPEMPQEQLFRMFVRASERSETGGIGLYLAKLSATRIFGKLSYSKNEQGHTVFTLLLHPNLQQRLAQVQQLREEKSKQEALIRARVQALSDEVL